MNLAFLNGLTDSELQILIREVRSISNKRYYEANKDIILSQQKEYREKKKKLQHA